MASSTLRDAITLISVIEYMYFETVIEVIIN